MDTQTRHALKKDKFAQATASSVAGSAATAPALCVGSLPASCTGADCGRIYLLGHEIRRRRTSLGAALDIYDAPLSIPGAPAENGVYSSTADRSKAANKLFAAVAAQYGWLPQGAKAHYFVGITDQETGQTAAAENELKTAGASWDRNLANLAKLALASIYHQTGRDSQAIGIYNALIAKPSETVSPA